MKTTIKLAMVLGTLAAGTLAQGCTLKSDDSSRFQHAIPQTTDVALGVPGGGSSSGAGGVTTQSLHTLGNPPAAHGNEAEWYTFTRNTADAVDWGTGAILGAVWIVVHLPPTRTSAHQAVWGPGQGDALDPVAWRLTVDEIGTDEYNYKLEGRPKASTSDSDFKSVLTGHGYGESRPEHKMGSFVIDQDAYNALDPSRAHDSGTVNVTFDRRSYPFRIEADVKHSADADFYDVTVTHEQDGSGGVDVTAHGDASTPKNGTAEDVVLHSRWDKTGAGRADVKISGGDVSAYPGGVVTGTECWASDFSASYYEDTANYKPTQGQASACVLPQVSF